MDLLRELREHVTQESIAYGYTLSVWGSGTLLLTSYTTPTPEMILAFITGGVVGFGLLAVAVFQKFFGEIQKPERHGKFVVASMVHIFASLGNVFLSYLWIKLFSAALEPYLVFGLVGVHATVTYNLMLLVEEILSEDIYHLEKRLS
ncbi:MAG: hypothetical protein ABEJ69_00215 [Candidatus Nanohaloarchaea archaeon]